jgi:hypothetical protein
MTAGHTSFIPLKIGCYIRCCYVKALREWQGWGNHDRTGLPGHLQIKVQLKEKTSYF